MKRKRITGLSLLGGVVLTAGGLLVNYGAGVPAAGAQTAENPLTTIITKEDAILGAIRALPAPQPSTDLSGVTQSWNKALPAAQRFVILAAFNNAAVLDKNTGLVWEQSPATTGDTWFNARFACASKRTGNQMGWRLPGLAELTSLVDPFVPAPGPTLPAGHPFLNVQSASYWSAASLAENPSHAWVVGFDVGVVGTDLKAFSNQVWCVRGGMNADQY